jgi:hypothetical protein
MLTAMIATTININDVGCTFFDMRFSFRTGWSAIVWFAIVHAGTIVRGEMVYYQSRWNGYHGTS